MSGRNPICGMAGYEGKVHKIFCNLRALDGNRKTVEMDYNMEEAIPEEKKQDVEYDTSSAAWYDKTGEIDDPNQALATRFEPSMNLKREERALTAMLKDCKNLIDKKSSILTY